MLEFEVTLAQELACETDELKVFQACVDRCMNIEQIEQTMAEWKRIRSRVEKRE